MAYLYVFVSKHFPLSNIGLVGVGYYVIKTNRDSKNSAVPCTVLVERQARRGDEDNRWEAVVRAVQVNKRFSHAFLPASHLCDDVM